MLLLRLPLLLLPLLLLLLHKDQSQHQQHQLLVRHCNDICSEYNDDGYG